jgi:hypothetical protein
MRQCKRGIQRKVDGMISSYGILRKMEGKYDYEKRERRTGTRICVGTASLSFTN